MSGNNSSRNKAIVAGAVGAGVLLAAAGISALWLSLSEKKRNVERLQRELARNSVNENRSSVSSRDRSSMSITSEEETVYYSAVNSDEEDDDIFENCISDEKKLQNLNKKEELFQTVDDLMKGLTRDKLEAFNMLKKHKFEMGEDADFLWRFAKAHQLQASAYGARNDLEKKKLYVFEGLDHAEKALSLAEENADVHKWFSILTGMKGEFVSVKEKIQNAHVFQKHLLIAIRLKPDDYSLHHLLGRFKFEIAKTSWIEKKMAESFFGHIPNFTYSDAIEDLLNAERLNTTPWKENRLLLARCYLESKEHPQAIKWLQSAKGITPVTEEDDANDRDIKALLAKYDAS